MRDTLLAVVLSKSATHVTIDFSSAVPLRNTLRHMECNVRSCTLSSTFQGLVVVLENCARFLEISWSLKIAVANTVGHSSSGWFRVYYNTTHMRSSCPCALSIVEVTLHWTHREWRLVGIILQRSSSMCTWIWHSSYKLEGWKKASLFLGERRRKKSSAK